MSVYPAVLGGVLAVAVLVAFLSLATLRRRRGAAERWGAVARLWFGAVWLGVVGLAATAALGIYGEGAALRGWPLLAHASLGGGVLVGLAGLALGFARSARTGGGWRWGPVGRSLFWTSLVAGVVAGGTILVSTLPLFGTGDLHGLIGLHKWGGLVLAVAMVLLGGLSLRRRARP